MVYLTQPDKYAGLRSFLGGTLSGLESMYQRKIANQDMQKMMAYLGMMNGLNPISLMNAGINPMAANGLAGSMANNLLAGNAFSQPMQQAQQPAQSMPPAQQQGSSSPETKTIREFLGVRMPWDTGNTTGDPEVMTGEEQQVPKTSRSENSRIDRQMAAGQTAWNKGIGGLADILDPRLRNEKKGAMQLSHAAAGDGDPTSAGESDLVYFDEYGQDISSFPWDMRHRINRGMPLTKGDWGRLFASGYLTKDNPYLQDKSYGDRWP